MAFDPERYRRDVLEPARRAGNRPSDDLLARYQLTEPLRAVQVREAVAAVTMCWQRQRGALAFKTVIAALEADHRALRELLQAAADGNLAPLQAELERRRSRQRDRQAALAEELEALSEPLKLLAPQVVDAVVAEGNDRAEVEAVLTRLKITVRTPDTLPTEPPVPAFRRLRTDLTILGCRHVGDFLLGHDALAGGFTVLDRFTVAGRAALDPGLVRDVATRWEARLDGKTVAEGILTVLRPLDADRLRKLLAFECIDDLRTRRERHAGNAALVKRGRELGLEQAEAARLAFAVRSEQVRRRSRLAVQLEELLDQHAVVAALHLVQSLGMDAFGDCRELATHASQLGARAVELCLQAAAATDPDTAWRLLDEAETLASDAPDMAQLRRRWPPLPAAQPSARVADERVVIGWQPSPSDAGAVTYRVLRSGRPFPPGHADSDLVAETPGSRAVDSMPPVNVPVYYAVVAERGGVPAPPATARPVYVRPDVTDLDVVPGNGAVSGAWRMPAGASGVTVRRATGRPPRDLADGVAVPATGSGLRETGLTNGVTYHYLVAVRYREPDGRDAHTAGVRFTALPMEPPTAVTQLDVAPAEREPGWLVATFAAPASGTVELRLLDGAPDRQQGARMAVAALPGRALAGIAVPGGIKCRAPHAAGVLAAVTVSGAYAVIGTYREWIPTTDITSLRARWHGDRVVVSWEWPDDVGEMEVRWRAEDGPWQQQAVSSARYIAGGGVTLTAPPGTSAEIVVAPVLRSGDRRMVGTGGRTRVTVPVAAKYTLRRAGLWHRRLVATVTADRAVHVSRLVLVARDNVLPLQPTDGDVVAALDDVDLGPQQPTILRIPLPRRPLPYWLRCFADADEIQLRDPPIEQLRMR